MDTWGGMECVFQLGLSKAIGVSNYSAGQLRTLVARGEVVPAVNQVESHPLLAQLELLGVCRELGVAFEVCRIKAALLRFSIYPELAFVRRRWHRRTRLSAATTRGLA